MNPRTALAVAVLLASGAPLPAQTPARKPSPPPASPTARAELDDLRSALETAIGRPGRVRLAAGARTAGRVYRLKGYGAVIVLAPRALPAPRFVVRRIAPEAPKPAVAGREADPRGTGSRVVITIPEGTFDLGVIDLSDLEHEMEIQMAAQAAALREMESVQMESVQRQWSRAQEEEMREHVRLVEQQAEAFRLEAERARRRAEREVRTRLAPPASPASAAEPAEPVAVPPPPAPVAPMVPGPPMVVAPVVEPDVMRPEIPMPPEMPDAPPPWRFWFDAMDGSDQRDGTGAADADAVVATVRERVLAGLDAYRKPLTSLRAEDFVTVAVDLVPDVLLRARPARTLLVRVRAGDLQDRRSGRLSTAEFRKRVEFEEN